MEDTPIQYGKSLTEMEMDPNRLPTAAVKDIIDKICSKDALTEQQQEIIVHDANLNTISDSEDAENIRTSIVKSLKHDGVSMDIDELYGDGGTDDMNSIVEEIKSGLNGDAVVTTPNGIKITAEDLREITTLYNNRDDLLKAALGKDVTNEINDEIRRELASQGDESRFHQDAETETDSSIPSESDENTVSETTAETTEEVSGDTDNDSSGGGMTIEELIDVPAMDLAVDNDDLRNKIHESYDVTEKEATELLAVMERYARNDKFKVYPELPDSLKREIDAAFLESGNTDPRIKEFFAKNLINSLVEDAYMSKSITDFQEEFNKIASQVGNIPGMIADSYTDEIKNNFETKLREIAENIREEDSEKADRLVHISNVFTETYTLSDILSGIKSRPSICNNAYKTGRDKYRSVVDDFKKRVEGITPRIKPIDIVYRTTRSLGYRDDYCKAFTVLVNNSIMSKLNDNTVDTVESHIYAYYIMLAFTNLSMNTGMTTSEVLGSLISSIDTVMAEIDVYMQNLWSSKSKKGGKKNRKNRK